tara:strand:+ start:10249 stop:11658 length:1410 start_codon:yes stop_codon:yes gene_type:complete
MIGKAIYNILKTHISDLATGGIYPVVMPQRSTNLSAKPAVIYNIISNYETSKNAEPDIAKAIVEIRVVSKTYKETDDVSKSLRYLLDHYRDQTYEGMDGIRGYVDYKGSKHNLISNVDIAEIFYQDQEDDYIDELFLYSRSLVYHVYYYDNVNKFCFNYKDTTSPLVLSLKADASIEKDGNGNFKSALIQEIDGARCNSGTTVTKWYNRIGAFYAKDTPTATATLYNNYLKGQGSPKYYSTPINDVIRPRIQFQGADIISVNDNTKPIDLSRGGLLIYVYNPSTSGNYNYLSGDSSFESYNPSMCLSHRLDGVNADIEFNPRGEFSTFSSETITLASGTTGVLWNGDVHFLALSIGGNKAQTGGSYNQSGWYEYFNSDNTTKLTTGQILENNSFTGNSETYSNSCNFATIGSLFNGLGSAGFSLYEFLLFVPESITTHGIDADAAPFQPTDIIYKKTKDYILNKYKSLK